jgi:hypothetical protein
MLDLAAQESVMQWKFMAARANGQPCVRFVVDDCDLQSR